MTLTTNMVIEL